MEQRKYSIEYIRDVITPIAKQYKIKRVYLFGSYARGDYNEHSDVDFIKTYQRNCNWKWMY